MLFPNKPLFLQVFHNKHICLRFLPVQKACTLMLLWSISALISAEIRYLMGAKLEVETFIEVAMVLVLRKLIIMPVQDITPDPMEVVLWVGAGLMLGLTFVLVQLGQKQRD